MFTLRNLFHDKNVSYLVIAYLILSTFDCANGTFNANGCITTNNLTECVHMSGKFLQNAEYSGIDALDISSCDMASLNKNDFSMFSNLRSISIENSSFSFPMHEFLFNSSQDLVDLRIIHNNNNEEIFKLFPENVNLRRLELRSNSISVLRKHFFGYLRRLEEINLSNNEIEYIEENTFYNFSSLKKLNLTGNRIGIFFNPTYVRMASVLCAVCRPNNNEESCSNNELFDCRINTDIDQLWWISNNVNIQLQNNPICSAISQHPNVTRHRQKSRNWPSNGRTSKTSIKACKVYEYGFCFKHESRRMFLLEVCGMPSIFPSPMFLRNPVATQKPVIFKTNEDENWDVNKIILTASLPSLLCFCFGIVLIAAVIGSLVTWIDLQRNKKIMLRRLNKKKSLNPI